MFGSEAHERRISKPSIPLSWQVFLALSQTRFNSKTARFWSSSAMRLSQTFISDKKQGTGYEGQQHAIFPSFFHFCLDCTRELPLKRKCQIILAYNIRVMYCNRKLFCPGTEKNRKETTSDIHRRSWRFSMRRISCQIMSGRLALRSTWR